MPGILIPPLYGTLGMGNAGITSTPAPGKIVSRNTPKVINSLLMLFGISATLRRLTLCGANGRKRG